jgi:hypothetical protein
MSSTRNLILSGGGLAALWWYAKRDNAPEPASSSRSRGYPSSIMGANKFPSIAGFFPQGATFSVWGVTRKDGVSGRGIKIGPIGQSQRWVRTRGPGGGSVAPYTADYDEDLPELTFVKLEDATVLRSVKHEIKKMYTKSPNLLQVEAGVGPAYDDSLPLVITMGAATMKRNDMLAVPEFEWKGEDPRP